MTEFRIDGDWVIDSQNNWASIKLRGSEDALKDMKRTADLKAA